MNKQVKMSLAMKIFIALIFAIIVGLLMQGCPDIADSYIKPFGTIFLNLVKFIVCPIVLFSIMSGVVSMKDIKKVGSIGGLTVLYYLMTTAVAITIGLIFGNLFKRFFPILSTTELEYTASEPVPFMEIVISMFPSNFVKPLYDANMLQIIVMALLMGFAVILLAEESPEINEKIIDGITILNKLFMRVMEIILNFSPIGVFCLLCPVVAKNGPMVLESLAAVLLTAYICYVIHAVCVYSFTVKIFAGINPIRFFKEMAPAMMFAFSSASSVGTLPINLKCVTKLGASEEVASFVLPLGATINMDGTAIYQGVCSIFIASCFGINLTLSQMLTIVFTATVASIGTAGVPGAGMVMLAMVLQSVGLPVEGIALVAGVDRIFDMGRTVLNITGDASCTVCVSHLSSRKK